MLKKITLLGVSALTAFAMNNAAININDTDLELGVKFDVGQFNEAVEPNTLFVGGKFLNADAQHSDNDAASLDPYFEANVLMMRPLGNKGMKIGMGIKVNGTTNFVSVPLGLEFSYKLPVQEYVPMYFEGALYYAPSALTYSDGDNFWEYRLNYTIEIIQNGKINLGYRSLKTNYKTDRGGDFTYNSYWYVGYSIGF